MRVRVAFLAILLVTPLEAWAQEKSLLEREAKGWIDLMPGKKLEGWKRVPLDPETKLADKNPWSVRGDILECDGVGIKEAFYHDREFTDGVFHLEWRFKKVNDKKDYNSGAYVRSVDGKLWHQVQIAHLDKPPFMGDLFGDLPVNGKIERVIIRGNGPDRVHPPGEWNTYEIGSKGKNIRVWINGATTLTWDNCQVPRGHVGMQAEFFFIEFKNLKFRPSQD
jgi:hypothetical protein